MKKKEVTHGKYQPKGVNLIQAFLLVQTQHDVFDHVQAIPLFPGQTFACAWMTGASSVSISSTLLIVLRRKRQTENDKRPIKLICVNRMPILSRVTCRCELLATVCIKTALADLVNHNEI